MKNILLFTLLLLSITFRTFSQEKGQKVWVSGAARGAIYMDQITGLDDDTITAKKVNSGHTLVDLGVNIRPNNATFIKAAVRIRNEYGGFWGSGITFDLRELYLKGLIAKSIRYQLGDINYKLTPFTFHNNDEEMYKQTPDVFQVYNEMLHYDLFYNNDHTWRQQGIAVDFALTFKKYIQEMQFNFFSSRLHPTNFESQSERIFAGGNITLVQSKHFSAAVNYVNLFDIPGTSENQTTYYNPVLTGTYAISLPVNNWRFQLIGESGFSNSGIKNDTEAPDLNDYFHYANVNVIYEPYKLKFNVGYLNVGAQFRSTGAQMKRINFEAEPIAYPRYTNEQILRPVGSWDITHDESIYNTQISTGLQAYNPKYDNISPYGLATPNRKGFMFDISKSDKKERYNVDLQYQLLGEIVGQGTDALRNFNVLDLTVQININKMIPSMNKKARVQFNFSDGSTKRNGQEAFESVDLKSICYSAGASWEFIRDFELMAGYQMHTAEGSELVPERDTYGEIIDFDEFHADLSEQMLGAGLRYNFTPKINLQFIWEDYKWEDKKALEPEYGFQRYALIFKMNF